MGVILLILLGLALAHALLVIGMVRDARHPARATAGWALARKIPPDPLGMGIPFEDRSFGDGQRVWRLPGAAANSAIVTIIVHGWRRSRIDSLRRLQPWLARSRAVLLVDLPGHGESAKGPSTLGITDHIDLATLALDELAALGSPTDGQCARVLLVGHSLGAGVALRTAMALPAQCVAGVVALAPYESLREPLHNRLIARGLPDWGLSETAQACLHLMLGAEGSTAGALRTLHERGVACALVASDCDRVVRAAHVKSLGSNSGSILIVEADLSHDDLGTKWQDATAPANRAIFDFADRVAPVPGS